METRLRNILRTTNVTEFINTILRISCKVLLGQYILAVPKHPAFFFNDRWILSDFWYLDCYNFCYIFRKNAKLYFLQASHRSLKTRQKSKSYFVFFGVLYFKYEKNSHFEFFIKQIFRQTFIISENLTYMGQLLLKLSAVKVAILFHLPQLIGT